MMKVAVTSRCWMDPRCRISSLWKGLDVLIRSDGIFIDQTYWIKSWLFNVGRFAFQRPVILRGLTNNTVTSALIIILLIFCFSLYSFSSASDSFCSLPRAFTQFKAQVFKFYSLTDLSFLLLLLQNCFSPFLLNIL